MAKQMYASTDFASCSYIVQSPPLQFQDPPAKTRRRRHRPPSDCRRSSSSPALLSVLATLVASSPLGVEASPAPLSFLYPSIDFEKRTPAKVVRRFVSPSKPTVHSPPHPSRRRSLAARALADKYEEGPDGRWRRVDGYTLYGSTVCPPTATIPSIDDQIQVPTDMSTPAPDVSDTADDSILNSLPSGWKPPTEDQGNRTTLILTLSLVLAFFICFFIIGCLFWRKTKRRKREIDVEMKDRRSSRAASLDDRPSVLDWDMRAKQKLWARATSRWKANARYTLRQRRGKRQSIVSRHMQGHDSTASLGQVEPLGSMVAESAPHSRPPSPQQDAAPEALEALQGEATVIITLAEDPAVASRASSPALPSSPPAYHQRLRVPSNHDPMEADYKTLSRRPSSSMQSRRPSHSSTGRFSLSEIDLDTEPDEESPPAAIHTAHVATDDKTLLAKLADFASAPPEHQMPEPSTLQSSAPVWQDEDFGISADHTTNEHVCASEAQFTSSPLPFPPPPSKGKSAALYDYAYHFEEIVSLEPEPEPSAPPFEEVPSAPLACAPPLIASAPPLFDVLEATDPVHVDNESHPQVVVSLPPGSPSSCHCTINVADLVDTESGDKGVPHLQHPSESDQPTPLIHGPIAQDGTLPCYYP
ncbi:hypothetical protein BDN72DRAFT_830644 [Pluteus cervinus]|uniref:Uncharacterized protein n=1 Tax=Pluteus cervinus TaxID=181527 RepID=A0ACD3BIC3_9AGAR|nr:hypothetical protein BDN72DRAFT_830644 [Pluteus cervinus]